LSLLTPVVTLITVAEKLVPRVTVVGLVLRGTPARPKSENPPNPVSVLYAIIYILFDYSFSLKVGKLMVKVVPYPNLLSTLTSPECSATNHLTIESPNPEPDDLPEPL
jgi:hypothetical protein